MLKKRLKYSMLRKLLLNFTNKSLFAIKVKLI